jgi:hypothetical protein
VDKNSDIDSKTEAEKAVEAEVETVEMARLAKRVREQANEDAKGSRMGGVGTQSGQTDFGHPENFAKPDF